ncbi:MAG: helix-hairpin-helix domain-containing protein [Pseudomonadota bacterium]
MTPGMIAIMFVCCLTGVALGWALRRERHDRDSLIKVQRAEQQLASQQESIEQLTRQREQLRDARQELTDQHHRSQRQIGVLRETLDEANARIRTLNQRIEAAKQAFENLKTREHNTRKQLKLMIRRTRDARDREDRTQTQKTLRPVASGVQSIKGIGPALARQLEAHGIRTLNDIAEMQDADIDALDQKLKFPGRIRRDRWVEQARELLSLSADDAA